MMRIKKIVAALLISCLFFVVSSLFAAKAFAAPRLFLDPASATVVIGNDIQVVVKIDVGSTPIFGSDAIINYPSDGFTVKSVTYGGFFTDSIEPSQSAGQVFIRGSFFSSTAGSGSGSGNFATITFNALKAGGTGTIEFGCSGSGSDTDIFDTNGNNILSCANVTNSIITFSTGVTPTPTPAPGSTPSSNGPTNACGGTCGSVYNCNVNLFCYQGYCRNPDCPADITCGCKATPTPKPTVKPKGGTTPTVKPSGTPVVVNLTKSTPFPTFEPIEAASPSGTSAGPRINLKTLGLWTGGIFIVVALIIIIVNSLKKKGPPKINFPSSTYPVEPPLKSNPPPTQTPPPAGF